MTLRARLLVGGKYNFWQTGVVGLTNEEYEDAYREALLCLAEEHHVGTPFSNGGGRRMCLVDGRILRDSDVLELWWGPQIASEIMADREPSQTTVLVAVSSVHSPHR